MKRKIGLLVLSLLLTFCVAAFTACDNTTKEAKVTLVKTTLTLEVDEFETLEITVENGEKSDATWASDLPLIASVDTSGKVTAVAKGTAVITVTLGDSKATCTVTVNDTAGDANSALGQAKTAAKAALDAYAVQTDYFAADWTTIQGYISTGKTAIDAATTEAAVTTAKESAQDKVDEVATKAAKITAGKTAVAALPSAEATYFAADWTTIQGFITTANTAIDAATTEAAITTAKATATTSINGIKTKATKQTEAKAAVAALPSAQTEYFAADWTAIQGHISSANTAIDEAATEAAITTAKTTAQTIIGSISTKIVKQSAAKTIVAALAAQADYFATDWTTIQGFMNTANNSIDAATDDAAITTAKTTAQTNISGVDTKAAKKTAGKASVAALATEANYFAADWTTIQEFMTTANTAIDGAATEADITTAKNTAQTSIAGVKSKATKQTEAKAAVTALKVDADFFTEDLTSVQGLIDTAHASIDGATTEADITTAKNTATTGITALTKAAKITAAKAAVAALAAQADYFAADWTTIQGFITTANSAIDAAADNDALTTAKTTAATSINSVDTKVTKQAAAKDAVSALKVDADFFAADLTAVQGFITAAHTAIDAATTEAAITTAKNTATTNINALKIANKITAAKTKLSENLNLSYYHTTEQDLIQSYITAAENKLPVAESQSEIDTIVSETKAQIDKVLNKRAKDALAFKLDGNITVEDVFNYITVFDFENNTVNPYMSLAILKLLLNVELSDSKSDMNRYFSKELALVADYIEEFSADIDAKAYSTVVDEYLMDTILYSIFPDGYFEEKADINAYLQDYLDYFYPGADASAIKNIPNELISEYLPFSPADLYFFFITINAADQADIDQIIMMKLILALYPTGEDTLKLTIYLELDLGDADCDFPLVLTISFAYDELEDGGDIIPCYVPIPNSDFMLLYSVIYGGLSPTCNGYEFAGWVSDYEIMGGNLTLADLMMNFAIIGDLVLEYDDASGMFTTLLYSIPSELIFTAQWTLEA